MVALFSLEAWVVLGWASSLISWVQFWTQLKGCCFPNAQQLDWEVNIVGDRPRTRPCASTRREMVRLGRRHSAEWDPKDD